jgi:Domain of unknown function (DUF4138)
MKMLFAFLTGYALLSQPVYVAAQLAAVHRSAINDLFVPADPGPPVPGRAVAATDRGDKPGEFNKAMLKTCCEKIVKDIQRVYFLSNRNGKIKLQVRGLYTRGTALFFALRLTNRSPLDYAVDSIVFFILQKGQHKQPPVRLNVISPVYVYDSVARIKGFGRMTSVMVLPRLRLARGQRLRIEVSEKNGGRQLQVLASPFILANARLI